MKLRRKKAPPDLTREELLREHMAHGGEGYNALQWLMPFVTLGGHLHESERKALWYEVYGFIKKVERNHFRQQRQKNKEYTDQRVLFFYELCALKWDKSISWNCKAFISAFTNIEAILMMRRWGLGGLAADKASSWQVYSVVTYFTLWRRHESYIDWYTRKYERYPQQKTQDTWAWRSKWVETLINDHLLTQFIEGVRNECTDETLQSDVFISLLSGEDELLDPCSDDFSE